MTQVQSGALSARIQHIVSAHRRTALPLLALLNGILLSRAFSPVNLFPLLFFCVPVMVLMSMKARNWAEAYLMGWWTGIGFLAISLSWIGHSFYMQGPNPNVPPALAPFAVFALSAYLSLYIGAAFALTRRLTHRPIAGVIVFASAWTMMELARGHAFTGFPWHIMSAVWVDWPAPLQMVYYLGSYGASFVTVLIAGLPVLAVLGAGRARIAAPVLSLVLIGLVFSAGAARLAGTETRYHETMTMRLVQPNLDQRMLWIRSRWDEYFQKQVSLSRTRDGSGKATGIRMLIWPESGVRSVRFDRDGSLERYRVGQLLDHGAYAFVGAPRYDGVPPQGTYRNSMLAVSSSADLHARYDKVHLVPFGEYIPFTEFFNSIGLGHIGGGAAFTPGQEKDTVILPGIPDFSPLICYEAIFPGEVLGNGQRPLWILNITNDGWFGSTEGPHQHLGLAKMRAVEEGLPLVRNAITGISAVVDPLGRTLHSLGIGKEGVIDATLPRAVAPPPLSSRMRIWLCLALSVAVIFFATILEKTNKHKSKK